jgi:hypothetical protein
MYASAIIRKACESQVAMRKVNFLNRKDMLARARQSFSENFRDAFSTGVAR